jgi:hypothetical protein
MPPRPERRDERGGGVDDEPGPTPPSITDTPVISADTVPIGGRGVSVDGGSGADGRSEDVCGAFTAAA